jgi:hypothetical protein
MIRVYNLTLVYRVIQAKTCMTYMYVGRVVRFRDRKWTFGIVSYEQKMQKKTLFTFLKCPK